MGINRTISLLLKIINFAFAAYVIYILIRVYIYFLDHLNSQSIDGILLNQDYLINSFKTLTFLIKLLYLTIIGNILFLIRVSFKNENIHINNKFFHYSLIVFLFVSIIYLFLFHLDSATSIKYEVEPYDTGSFYINIDYFSNQIIKLMVRVSLVLIPIGLFIFHLIKHIKIIKK